ncbi:MAG TPA: hypothetical protein VKQ30_07525 [Ktedonobacterales bacterium]|nr:hypothetical protein [Ktedonobacterales bacterium]
MPQNANRGKNGNRREGRRMLDAGSIELQPVPAVRWPFVAATASS